MKWSIFARKHRFSECEGKVLKETSTASELEDKEACSQFEIICSSLKIVILSHVFPLPFFFLTKNEVCVHF